MSLNLPANNSTVGFKTLHGKMEYNGPIAIEVGETSTLRQLREMGKDLDQLKTGQNLKQTEIQHINNAPNVQTLQTTGQDVYIPLQSWQANTMCAQNQIDPNCNLTQQIIEEQCQPPQTFAQHSSSDLQNNNTLEQNYQNQVLQDGTVQSSLVSDANRGMPPSVLSGGLNQSVMQDSLEGAVSENANKELQQTAIQNEANQEILQNNPQSVLETSVKQATPQDNPQSVLVTDSQTYPQSVLETSVNQSNLQDNPQVYMADGFNRGVQQTVTSNAVNQGYGQTSVASNANQECVQENTQSTLIKSNTSQEYSKTLTTSNAIQEYSQIPIANGISQCPNYIQDTALQKYPQTVILASEQQNIQQEYPKEQGQINMNGIPNANPVVGDVYIQPKFENAAVPTQAPFYMQQPQMTPQPAQAPITQIIQQPMAMPMPMPFPIPVPIMQQMPERVETKEVPVEVPVGVPVEVPVGYEFCVNMPNPKKSVFKGIVSFFAPGLGQAFDGRLMDGAKFFAKEALSMLGGIGLAFAAVSANRKYPANMALGMGAFTCFALNLVNRIKAADNANNSQQIRQEKQVENIRKQANQIAKANHLA